MARRALGPATLAVVQAVEAHWAGGDVLVACSGGSDSLALAVCATIAGRRQGFGVRAVVIDHGLQRGSVETASGIAATLSAAGTPAEVIAVDVRLEGRGMEAAARDARYSALSEAAQPGETILLGHTLDDQAETVLLGLARGSGTRSLAGKPARRGVFQRPLLGVRSAVTTAACRELGLTWFEDAHNTDDRYTRVRVRHRVLPVLEEQLGPGVAEALARTADLARQDADALDDLAAERLSNLGADGLDCAWLGDQPPALRGRIVRTWLAAHGAGELGWEHLRAVLTLVDRWRGQRWIDVPGLRVARRQGALVCLPGTAAVDVRPG